MLDITQLDCPTSTKNYYFTSSRADYYLGSQEKPGIWGGKAAGLMGLNGTVTRDDFASLCDNFNPITNKQLTSRQNKKRRVGYDVCYGPPKSVSIIHALTGDHRIQVALEGAFTDTLKHMEKDAQTRVRKDGQQVDRNTGNLVWAQFTHKYSRPAERDGRILPDPHLHCHGVIFNSTFDPVEKRWKAAQLGDIKRDAKYFQECMHNRLICRLQKLGYQIKTSSEGWEIAGVSPEIIDKFSQRSHEIELARLEEEKLMGTKLSAKQTAQLGRLTRRLKSDAEQVSELELKQIWRKRLTPEELKSIASNHHKAKILEREIKNSGLDNNSIDSAKKGLKFAANHCFETQSVMDKRRFIAEAIRASYGKVQFQTIEQSYCSSGMLSYEENGRTWCTTPTVRKEEQYFLRFAREGHLSCKPFTKYPNISQIQKLSDQQKLAYTHVLTSKDRVIGIRGKAGTGKTTMMVKTVSGLEKTGQKVLTFAPTRAAVQVLKNEGFKNTETIQKFLLNQDLQNKAQDSILWIDEAGLLSSRQMSKLATIANQQNCRIILSGDTGQHSAVERGDAMRILEAHGGLRPVQLDQIFRQKDAVYNDAIKHLSNGEIEDAFDKFETLGSIVEIEDENRPKKLALEYMKSTISGRSALIVSPTHLEGQQVSMYIRKALLNQNKLIGLPHKYKRLVSLGWTTAKRKQAHNFEPGQLIEPHAAINRKLPRGKKAKVIEVIGNNVWVQNNKKERVSLDLSQGDKFEVFSEKNLSLLIGDKIRITRTGKSVTGKKISTGHIDEVTNIETNGDIVLKGGATLPADFGHINHGYCVTSHSSQGRTVDDVFIAESAMSFPAASLQQFYVSCSRGRERLRIFTDDKEELKQAISRSCARKSTHDFNWDAQEHLRSRMPKKMQQVARDSNHWIENFSESTTTYKSIPSLSVPEITKTVNTTPDTISIITNQPSINIDK